MKDLGIIRRMYYRDGLSLSEIERRTGLTRKTVRSWPEAPTHPLKVTIKDRNFNDPKASISVLFAPRQTKIAPGNLTFPRRRIARRLKSDRIPPALGFRARAVPRQALASVVSAPTRRRVDRTRSPVPVVLADRIPARLVQPPAVPTAADRGPVRCAVPRSVLPGG